MSNALSKKSVFTKKSLKKQFRWSEYLAKKIITIVAFLSIAIIFLIFVFVFKESLPLFSSTEITSKTEIQKVTIEKPETYGEPLEDLTLGIKKKENQTVDNKDIDHTWNTFISSECAPVSKRPRFGLIALFVGTLKVTIIAIFLAGPLSILAAIYTSCFASKRRKEIIKPIIEMLAAFPSVVIGFFAMMILATFFQDIFGYDSRLNAFIGGIAMALAAIPIIYTISEDALSSVPKTYKEASLAIGASQWQTAFFVILPAAIPGIFAALLLGIGRVFGETMIALMATGNAALLSSNPFESVRTFAATIGSEMAETVFGETHYSVLFFIGSLLFIFSFTLNAVAEFYVKGKLVKKFQGK